MNSKERKRIQKSFENKIDYDELMNCTRCGFCLPSCPTYIETDEDELHSPRGRIALMKGVVDGVIEPNEKVKQAIDLCLGCRACEPVCPSGVQFGKLLEQARHAIYSDRKQSLVEKSIRHIAFKQLFPHQNRIRRTVNVIGMYQRLGIQKIMHKTRLINLLPNQIQLMEKTLPTIPTNKKMKNRPSNKNPLHQRKKRVAFFTGCLMDTMFMKTNDATIKLLQYAGCEIVMPQNQSCCGALNGHSGDINSAIEMAKRNIDVFENEKIDYIITNAGGCGAYLVNYAQLLEHDPEWKQRAQKFSSKIKDISSILVDLNFHREKLTLPEQTVTYQDSCHLRNGQKTFIEPRKLLEAIDGVTYVEMNEANRCCGSAGIYNLIQREMSMKILDYKMDQVKVTNAHTVVTTNPGCLLQMKLGIERENLSNEIEAVYLVDILLMAYENGREKKEQN